MKYSEEEIWKPFPNDPNYLVSSKGRVYTLYRNRMMKPTILNGNKGYMAYNVHKSARPAHRLVTMTFIPNPDNKEQVHHIDNNPKNNDVSNLMWVTVQENLDEARERSGDTTPIARAALAKVACKPVRQLTMDDEFVAEYPSLKAAVKANNNKFLDSKIGSVANGLRKSHGGYHWEWVNKEDADRGRSKKHKKI